jgi:hypothetical protein
MPDIRHGLEARACARAHTSLDDIRVGCTASICEADSPKPIARGPWIEDSDRPRDAPRNHCGPLRPQRPQREEYKERAGGQTKAPNNVGRMTALQVAARASSTTLSSPAFLLLNARRLACARRLFPRDTPTRTTR